MQKGDLVRVRGGGVARTRTTATRTRNHGYLWVVVHAQLDKSKLVTCTSLTSGHRALIHVDNLERATDAGG